MEDSDHPGLNISAALRGTQYGADDNWVEHVPFVSWLVDALQPRVIVDLVTDRAGLWVAFCEAAQSSKTCQVHVGPGNGRWVRSGVGGHVRPRPSRPHCSPGSRCMQAMSQAWSRPLDLEPSTSCTWTQPMTPFTIPS